MMYANFNKAINSYITVVLRRKNEQNVSCLQTWRSRRLSANGLWAGGGSLAAAWQRQTNVNMTSRDCRRRIGITVTVSGRLNLRLAKWRLIFVGATFLA